MTLRLQNKVFKIFPLPILGCKYIGMQSVSLFGGNMGHKQSKLVFADFGRFFNETYHLATTHNKTNRQQMMDGHNGIENIDVSFSISSIYRISATVSMVS